MKRQTKLIALLIAMSATSFGVTPSIAGPQHNCNNYASFAVSDAFKAQNNQCGLTGSRWSTDFNTHRNWCVQSSTTMAMLTTEDKIRKAAVGKCVNSGGGANVTTEKFCNKYAQFAIQQQGSNIGANCGLKDNRWSLNFQSHKNWCMSATKTAAQKEGLARITALSQCGAKP